MSGAALSDVVLSRRGGGDPVRLAGAGVRASWALNAAGALSVLFPDGDLLAALARFGRYDPKGLWVRWEHPTAGAWGGRVVADEWRPGTAELAAEGWLSLLRRRRSARTYRQQSATPGALWMKMLIDLANDSPTWVASASADEDGQPVAVEWRGEDAWEVTQRLVNGSGFSVRADADRNLSFRKRQGSDKTGTVLLADGRGGAIVGYRWRGDLWTAENDLLGVSGDREFERASGVIVEDGPSIERYGRLQGSRVYPGLTLKNAIRPRVLAELADVAEPLSALELEVADVGGAWANFREGDTVRVELGRASAALALLVEARSLDLDRGTMLVAGPAEVIARGI